MTQMDWLIGICIASLLAILFGTIWEAAEQYRERKKILRNWELMKRKELDHE